MILMAPLTMPLTFAKASCLYPISDTISEAEAIMTEPLANVVHFFRTAMSEVPDSLTIMGAGAIGILALSMAKLRGIARVCVVDKNEGRLEVARQLKAAPAKSRVSAT